jgi:hypothetical protein
MYVNRRFLPTLTENPPVKNKVEVHASETIQDDVTIPGIVISRIVDP